MNKESFKNLEIASHIKPQNLLTVCFFLLYLIIGLLIYDNFGATWDEPLNRDLGITSCKYIQAYISGNKIAWSDISQHLIAEQGPFYEIVLVAIEKLINIHDSHDILMLRHLITFLTFWFGTIAFYMLLYKRLGCSYISLFGTLLLILSPRLFSHTFYNSKDAALTALFIICTLTLIMSFDKKSVYNAIIHALSCAIVIDTRAVGLVLPTITYLCLYMQARNDNTELHLRKIMLYTVVYTAFLSIFIYAFWPALWDAPISNLIKYISNISAAKQLDNNFSLYMGRFIRVDQLPWHYLPVWMTITLPLPYTFFLTMGVFIICHNLTFSRKIAHNNLFDLILLSLLIIPIIAVIIIRPILYDDWRHFYFLHPYIIAIATIGISNIIKIHKLRNLVIITAILIVIHGISILVYYHPYQNIYFNQLAGSNIDKNFELDYWGLSFKEGLNFILKDQSGKCSKVAVSDYPGEVNHLFLKRDDRDRIQIVPIQEASYFLSNHRQPVNYTLFYTQHYPCINEIHKVNIGKTTLAGVFKLNNN